MAAAKIVGSTWFPLAKFKDANEVPYDPDTVTALVIDPDLAGSNPTMVNVVVGSWTTVILLDLAGFWFIDVTGTGPDGAIVVLRGSVCVQAALEPASLS